jgi:pyruvate-ferredoxin/flavodoxin oxidoreductase
MRWWPTSRTLDVPKGEIRVGEQQQPYSVPQGEALDQPELLLGALFGTLADAGLIDQKPRRVLAARRALLDGVEAGQRDVMMEAFQAGFEQVDVADVAVGATGPGATGWTGDAPAAVRHLGRDDDVFASLPRFWDQAGVLYRNGQADRLTADPRSMTPAVRASACRPSTRPRARDAASAGRTVRTAPLPRSPWHRRP